MRINNTTFKEQSNTKDAVRPERGKWPLNVYNFLMFKQNPTNFLTVFQI